MSETRPEKTETSRATHFIARCRNAAPILLLLPLLLGLLLVLQLPQTRALRDFGQLRVTESDSLGSGRLEKILTRLGLLHAIPYRTDAGAATNPSGRPGPGGRTGPVAWSLDALAGGDLPSSHLSAPEVAQGTTVVSLSMPTADLAALLDSPTERRIESERAASLSLFGGGELRFASGVGVRVHGGRSRSSSPSKSLRLYFDHSYGASGLPAELLPWGTSGSYPRLVLHNDIRHDFEGRSWHSANPMAYDIARRIGALAPRTMPITLYFNDERWGLYYLTERIDETYLERHFGHDSFTFYRTKVDPAGESRPRRFRQGDRDDFVDLRRWAQERAPLELAEVEERVDLDNLIRWYLSVTFCATTDPYQGALLRDESDPDARWFWVNWDMDHSFMNTKSELPGWQVDMFQFTLERPHPSIRSRLLRRLWRSSPAFHERVVATYEEAIEDGLSAEFLDRLLDDYRRVADTHEGPHEEYLELLAEFVAKRKAVYARQFRSYFGELPSADDPSPGPSERI